MVSRRLQIALLAGLLLPPIPLVSAQVTPDTLAVEEDLEAALDHLSDLSDAESDPAALVERLAALAASPLDLNVAAAEDLVQIPALTPLVARRIVAFREQFGAFASIPEIRAVEGVTEDVFLAARPYLTLGEPLGVAADRPRRYPEVPRPGAVLRGLRYEVVQRFTRRLDVGQGYGAPGVEAVYAGSPARFYTRLRARYDRRVSLNLTLEKDPGEAFRWNPDASAYGYDYASAHIALQNVGRVRALVLGDFNLQLGQGLALWQGGAFGKGREPVRPIARFGRGLVPYGSTDENRFFRGAAATLRPRPWLEVTAFASRRTLDAALLEPDSTALGLLDAQAGSLGRSGLHRLPREIAQKDVLGERTIGGALVARRRRGHAGVAGYHARFDPPLAPAEEPYRRYRLQGDRATLGTVFGHLFLGDLLLFGEAAADGAGTVAALAGLQAEVGRAAEAVVLVRRYPFNFQSPHGAAFGERQGATENESGVYTALRLRPAERWTVAGYVDHYRFPWLRFAVDRPTAGREALVVVEHRPRRWLSYYVQGRTETREGGFRWTDPGGYILSGVRPETRQSLRLHGDYLFSDALRLRARVEWTRHRAEGEPDAHGTLLYQDLRWRPRPWLQADARLAHFDAQRYEARVYAYENDLLYTFAVPAFTGRGRRSYVLLRLALRPSLSLQLKYATTRFEDAEALGSGPERVEGNRLREVRAQVRWSF